MKNALNNQVGMLGGMFLWLVANLKQGVIYFIKQALPPNKSAGSVLKQQSKHVIKSWIFLTIVLLGILLGLLKSTMAKKSPISDIFHLFFGRKYSSFW